jgi:hypothetical protein
MVLGLGFEPSTLSMAGMAQVIEHLFMPRAAWARILSFMLSASYFAFCIAGITGTHYHTQLLLVEMGVSLTFCSGCPQNTIVLTSSSQELGLQV